MSTAKPVISVVIPALDAAETLDRCLASLACQTWREFEVVVCDALSTDATVEVSERWSGQLPGMRIDARRDGGIYQGVNRGIGLAQGRWILVLGADDRIAAPDTLATVARILDSTSARFVYGDVVTAAANPWGPPGTRYPGPISPSGLVSINICQQSVFYRRDLFDRHGMFRPEYRVCADWDMAVRVAATEPIQWMDVVVAEYAATGMSSRTTDDRFRRDRPLLVAKMVLKRPLDPRFIDARYALATFSREALRDGDRRLDAFWIKAAAQWLAVMGGLRRHLGQRAALP
jgi:glycosyltransferase involved in cell wall biosynthesis